MKAVCFVLLPLCLASLSLAGTFSPITYPSLSSISCTNTTPLYFGLLMSFDAEQFDGSGAIAGVNVALDRINSNCSLLPGYSLHYVVADSRCTRTGGLDALFEDTIFRSPDNKIAVMGSGCSLATEPTAEVSHYYNISHLSCVSSSPALTDRGRFRSYFQLLNSEVTIAYAYYAVIKEYGWRHVSLIVQDENLFTSPINILKGLLTQSNITYDERSFSTAGGVSDLGSTPFNLERRIHLIASYASHARQLMCQAYSLGVFLPRYVLLTPAWYPANWWRVNDTDCDPEVMETVLARSIAFLHFDFLDRTGTNNVISQDGLTASEYLNLEASHINTPPLELLVSDYAPYCYDATWTLLYALQDTLTEINDSAVNQNLSVAYGLPANQSFSLSDFTYNNDALQQIMFRHLNRTHFDGITGKVQFSDQGIREVTRLFIFQFRRQSDGLINWVEIGEVTNNGTNFVFTGEAQETVWPDGIPYDGIPFNATATIHPAVTTMYFILTTAGIVFAVVCLIFNFVFRERKLIRLTSPKLNFLLGIGAIILYFNLYLFIFPVYDATTAAVLCNLTPWLTAVGYSLCYGTIVVKMTRVYYIFNNPTPNKAKVQDWKLFLGVFALVAIDVIILAVYTFVEGFTVYPDGLNGLQAQRVVSRESPELTSGVDGQVTRFFIFVCDRQSRDIMLGVLYGYKALVQVVALVFSFSIRKVKVKGLDDAIFIAGAIYISSIVLAVILVSTYTLSDFLNVYPVVFCTGFFIGTTVILGLVFIPLMIGLYKDPTGDTIFDKSKTSIGATMNTNLQTQTVEGLKNRVTELEAIVASTGGISVHGMYRVNGKETNSNVAETDMSTVPSQPALVAPPTPQQEMLQNLREIAGESPRERTNTIWDTENSSEGEK